MMKLVLLCLVFHLAVSLAQVEKKTVPMSTIVNSFDSDYEVGDPRRCLQIAMKSGFSVKRFEVLPGIGWDNLRNEEAGQVISYNYSRCVTTDDGRFLVPDNVFTIPIKSSFVETNSEFFDTWHNSSSTTSHSINVDAGGSYKFFAASGSFSREHIQIKAKQIEDKASTTRVQLRYHRYQVRVQPDPQLHPTFKSRLLDMAANIELNMTDRALFEAELLVRDFGTHVQTGVMAGANLVKTDFLSREYIATQFTDHTKLTASASASFAGFFHMSAQYSSSTTKVDTTSYEKGVTHSFVTSHGGPIMKAFNMTTNQWTDGVDYDLVPVDRSGDPIFYLINKHTLPEVPAQLRDELHLMITHAVEQYYEMNTIRGCTKMGSPNFSFAANFDDGSCEEQATNMTFGGVYQTCSVSGSMFSSNPCNGMSQVNPKTKSFSCPPPYTAVLLNTGKKRAATQSRRVCHHCGFLGLSHCCHDEYTNPIAVYETHWCAALGHVAEDSGYLFGGIYSSSVENPTTGTKGCPPKFYARLILADHYICISDDFELGAAAALPFGGFSSCTMGNPLALPNTHPVGFAKQQVPLANSLEVFMSSEPDAQWPKKCPQGFSQHLVAIDTGCEIRYCVTTGSLSSPNLPPVKLPPFNPRPPSSNLLDNYVMFNTETEEWQHGSEKTMDPEGNWDDRSFGRGWSASGNNAGISSGAVASISIIATLATVALATVIAVALFKRHKASKSMSYHEIRREDSSTGTANYGATLADGATMVSA